MAMRIGMVIAGQSAIDSGRPILPSDSDFDLIDTKSRSWCSQYPISLDFEFPITQKKKVIN